MGSKLALLITLLAFFSPLHAKQRDFSECITDWQQQAKEIGLKPSTIEEVIPELRHLPEIIGYDRAQPEFTQTFAQYLDRRLTPARVDYGQTLLYQHEEFLADLTLRYGIAGRYLVAFWGLETNYGSYLGKMPTLSSLATLACDPRRSGYFTEELFAALSLMERESFTAKQMQGSWAGAMGHTQFMPSAYRQYAIDGDADGRIDLWDSHFDALASGANFLKQLGWRAGQDWGLEVILPDDFDYQQTGLKNRQPSSHWSATGVTTASGEPLPEDDINVAILLPAGHRGPAFAVFPNFDVIMRWNRSEFYALAVGLLADYISGDDELVNPPPLSEKALSRSELKLLQVRLNALGHDAGEPDGVMGPQTRAALRGFQSAAGLIADGYPDDRTRQALLESTTGSN